MQRWTDQLDKPHLCLCKTWGWIYLLLGSWWHICTQSCWTCHLADGKPVICNLNKTRWRPVVCCLLFHLEWCVSHGSERLLHTRGLSMTRLAFWCGSCFTNVVYYQDMNVKEYQSTVRWESFVPQLLLRLHHDINAVLVPVAKFQLLKPVYSFDWLGCQKKILIGDMWANFQALNHDAI